MAKTILLRVILLIYSGIVYSQDFALIGIVDSKLVTLDPESGQATFFQDLPGLTNFADLTYHETDDAYYSIINTTNSPSLIRIHLAGTYEVVGSFTLAGSQIPTVESLAYSINLNKLYASVSLNGGVSDNDFYSESIVEVNPLTGECLFLTEISTNHPFPDIDVMTFSNNDLFIVDGAPPGANFLSIYKLSFQNLASNSNPVLLYENTYLPITDLTASGSNLYFVEGKNLHKYSISSNSVKFIGQTHANTDFNGDIIRGLSKRGDCIPPVVDLGQDQNLCIAQTITLDATYSGASYLWQDGSTAPNYIVTESGSYWVSVENSCGNSLDTIAIQFNAAPVIELGPDQTVCNNVSIQLDATVDSGTYLWQDGSIDSTLLVTTSGAYWVEVSNPCGSDRDTITINFDSPIDIDLGPDQSVCGNDPILLNATVPSGYYQWQDGNSNPTYPATKTGTYWVRVVNTCGSDSDTIMLEFKTPPEIDLGSDRVLCDTLSTVLDASINHGTYLWQDGSSEPTYIVSKTGTYWVEVKNDCGKAQDSIEIIIPEFDDLEIPNVFTPNGDGINDYFIVDSRLIGSTLEVFQRSGVKVFESFNYRNDWNGSNLPSGVYFWLITNDCSTSFKGWVNIIY